MSSILFLIILAIVSTEISGQAPGFNIGEAQVRWRLNCDMVGPNIEFKSGPGEQCGGLCNENRYIIIALDTYTCIYTIKLNIC